MERLLDLMAAIEELVNPLAVDRNESHVEISFSSRKSEYIVQFCWASPSSTDAAKEIISAHHARLDDAIQLAIDDMRALAATLIEQATKKTNRLIEVARL